jgi:hypothetical protein
VRFGALGIFHPARRAAVLRVACRCFRAPGGARVREGSGGFEDPRLGRSESLEGQKTRRASATRLGACPGAVRTDSKRDQGFEAGEAGGGGRPRRSRPRATGKRGFGLVKRGPIVLGGSRRPRSNVGVGETGGETVTGDASPSTVDDCRGAKAAWERARDLDEGKALKGGSPGTVAA